MNHYTELDPYVIRARNEQTCEEDLRQDESGLSNLTREAG